MSGVGGFFELETRHGAEGVWHRDALALTSGRSCLRAILDVVRPARVLVPFFICDAVLEPLRILKIPCEFYGVTQSLDPPNGEWPTDAAVLLVNYFDLKRPVIDALAPALGKRAIVDDTQAFFRRGHGNAFSFNSARKFFGVPDGAYVYGPGMNHARPSGQNDAAPAEHLSTRLEGDQERAYRQYQAAEAQVSCEVLSPSRCSVSLLAAVAYSEARVSRRRNFMQVHERLGDRNTLPIDYTLDADAAPFCYPFLPARPSLHEPLWRRGIFVPRLWPEVVSRPGPVFAWERDLAARLLPLPVDHRYGSDDMQRMCDAVDEVAG
jgi:hypothetical protein